MPNPQPEPAAEAPTASVQSQDTQRLKQEALAARLAGRRRVAAYGFSGAVVGAALAHLSGGFFIGGMVLGGLPAALVGLAVVRRKP